jgi:thiol:disulfide interchange protein DsbD
MKVLEWRLLFVCWLILLLGFLTAPLLCQENSDALAKQYNAKHWIDKKEASAGDSVTVFVQILINKGFHVYSAIPPAMPANKPTEFILDPETKGVTLSGGLQEKGNAHKYFDDLFETDVIEYKDSVTFFQKFKVTESNAKIVGALGFQICNEAGQCIYQKIELEYALSGESAAPSKASASPTSDAAPESPAQRSLEKLFLMAFFAGLLALLTPCVFPMIPMTVSFFTKRTASRSAGIRGALTYSFFIVFIFVVLGLLITTIFGATALYNLSVDPYVNLVFFAIIFAFGLSFLGAFEITLPASLLTAVDSKSNRGGLIGLFFMALTQVLASFSCTGPIAGYLLVDAASGGLLGPTIGMLGFSLGFAIPFGLFALFPGLLKTMPRAGGWLNSVKVTLGFLEIALSLKFLSQTDLILHWGILDREIFIGIWIVIFTLLGFYFLGKIRMPHDSPVEKISVTRLMLAMASFSFVLYIVPGIWGAPLEKLSGLLPPTNDEVGVRIAPYYAGSMGSGIGSAAADCPPERKFAEKLAEHAPEGYCLYYDLDEAISVAKAQNKPLFIDFTGHTCANCREMERKVWSKPEIRELFKNNFVMVSLYVDETTALEETIKLASGKKLRTIGDKWQNLQIEKYKQLAQPYYVITHPSDTSLQPLVPGKGYTPDVNEYKAFLEAGLQSYKQKVQ